MGWIKVSDKTINEDFKNQNHDLLKRFIKEKDILFFKKDFGYSPNIETFFKNGGKEYGNKFLQKMMIFSTNFAEHSVFFKDSHGRVILACNSYLDADKAMEEFTTKFNQDDFEIAFHDPMLSWYWPGHVNFFTIQLKSRVF